MRNILDMTDKVVLITGGSRGLGRAMAQGFAEHGAHVAIVSRKLDACESAAREIESLGRRAFPYACHVGHWDELDAMVDAVYEHFGPLYSGSTRICRVNTFDEGWGDFIALFGCHFRNAKFICGSPSSKAACKPSFVSA